MKSLKQHRLIILGSGPAGYTAAIYASRANLSPVLITGLQEGGQLMTTTDVDNWPGDGEGLQGPALMERMKKHAERFQVKIISDVITSANLEKKPFLLEGDETTYACDALIIATGATAKYLGLPAEAKFMGKGVSACATCDGFFYRGLRVAVVGGGNTAVEEALYLSNIAAHVTLIHRRDKLRAEKMLVDKLNAKAEKGHISFAFNRVVEDIVGTEQGVTGAVLKELTAQTTETLSIDGIFIAIGHTPNTSLFEQQLRLEKGYIITQSGRQGNVTATHIPGVFAAGDVTDSIYRQAVSSAGMGCMAALDAEKYLDSL